MARFRRILQVTRRELLTRLAPAVATGAALAACTDGSDSDATDDPSGTDATDDTEPPVPPWCDVVAGDGPDWHAVPLAAHPQLASVGGFTTVTVAGERLNLAHVEEGCFVAMGVVCTHEGCTVDVVDNPGPRFVCPCHGALYDWEGQPIAGPAPDPLPTYPAARRDDAVWVRIPG